MIDPSSLPYRQGVGLMLFNADGLVWAGRRNDQDEVAWQMPQGGIDEGETPEQAALRELEEEIGTAKAEIVAESAGWLTYDLPPELVGVVWKGRYRGQKQKWFALRFTGKESDIRIDTEHPEFAEWRWVEFGRLVELIVPFKRDLYRQVTAEFAELAKTLRR
jgi:putative (di)nucleoside polyphosphate hydrolase